jgi:hypothetical protein
VHADVARRLSAALEQGVEVVDVAVDVAVGEQAEQCSVERRRREHRPPAGVSKREPEARASCDQLGALVEDAAGADRVVADLAVAHVVVGRQADRRCRGP